MYYGNETIHVLIMTCFVTLNMYMQIQKQVPSMQSHVFIDKTCIYLYKCYLYVFLNVKLVQFLLVW